MAEDQPESEGLDPDESPRDILWEDFQDSEETIDQIDDKSEQTDEDSFLDSLLSSEDPQAEESDPIREETQDETPVDDGLTSDIPSEMESDFRIQKPGGDTFTLDELSSEEFEELEKEFLNDDLEKDPDTPAEIKLESFDLFDFDDMKDDAIEEEEPALPTEAMDLSDQETETFEGDTEVLQPDDPESFSLDDMFLEEEETTSETDLGLISEDSELSLDSDQTWLDADEEAPEPIFESEFPTEPMHPDESDVEMPEEFQFSPSIPAEDSLEDPEPKLIPEDQFDMDVEFGSEGFEGDSGWLDMLDGSGEGDQPSDPTTKPEEVKKSETDWLERIKRLNKSSDFVDDDSSFPDWLTVSEKSAQEAAAQPEEQEDSDPESSEVPEWLQLDEDDLSLNDFLRKKDRLDDDYKPKITGRQTAELVGDPPLPTEPEEDPAQAKKFPSWADGESPDPDQIPEELQFLAGVESETPPQRIVDPFDTEEDDAYLDDLFSDELPDWLNTATAIEETPAFEVDITRGELPGWVEAMRPVVESSEATDLADDEEYIENYGPLAGIPSVLPAEADIVQDPDKETTKPVDLLVTKSQQEYIGLIKKLIGDEAKVKPIIQPAPIQTQRVLRWLIAIILLITITVTIIFGGTLESYTDQQGPLITTSYGSLFNDIENLSDSDPVLIAFDYQPASIGEMHTAAASVVDHLMDQGTYLSFISTEPTGPALAEYFLETTQADHQYRHTQQYINLGYIPGESAGLVSFVIAPKQIIPLAFDGSNAWGAPPLQSVNSIQDFKMILVITDNPNTAKNWIEQVGTNLENTPLTMVVSAQAEPLVQPYFRSSPQLLTGYVAGVIDSINYEQLQDTPNLATKNWLPFNLGIIISVGTIFIGGLANGVLSLFSRHRKRPIEETEE
jgi:hypothetical protein